MQIIGSTEFYDKFYMHTHPSVALVARTVSAAGSVYRNFQNCTKPASVPFRRTLSAAFGAEHRASVGTKSTFFNCI